MANTVSPTPLCSYTKQKKACNSMNYRLFKILTSSVFLTETTLTIYIPAGWFRVTECEIASIVLTLYSNIPCRLYTTTSFIGFDAPDVMYIIPPDSYTFTFSEITSGCPVSVSKRIINALSAGTVWALPNGRSTQLNLYARLSIPDSGTVPPPEMTADL